MREPPPVVGGAATDSTLTLNIASGTNTFAGSLGGGSTNENKLALAKTGADTLELSGTNSYTGTTTVSNGTLKVSGALSGTTALDLGGGTLLLGNSDLITTSANVTLGTGGKLDTAGFSEAGLALVAYRERRWFSRAPRLGLSKFVRALGPRI